MDPVTSSKGFAKSPKNIAQTHPSQANMVVDTVWEDGGEELAMCVFPIFMPIPFGFDIDVTVFDDTLIDKMKKISPSSMAFGPSTSVIPSSKMRVAVILLH